MAYRPHVLLLYDLYNVFVKCELGLAFATQRALHFDPFAGCQTCAVATAIGSPLYLSRVKLEGSYVRMRTNGARQTGDVVPNVGQIPAGVFGRADVRADALESEIRVSGADEQRVAEDSTHIFARRLPGTGRI